MPEFDEGQIGQLQKQEFVEITKSIYKLQPKIFIKTGELQKRSFLGFLKLLIDSNEREHILKIIESIVEMTPEERTDLVKLLQVTSLSKMVSTMNEIIRRIKNIDILNSLINEYTKYTNEREHIQKIMEDSFWLFGEQYSLVAADKTFVKALYVYYVNFLNKNLNEKEKFDINHTEKNRRPDLFLTRQYPSVSSAHLYEDNIIVELKRPSVIIGMEEVRQIEDYMNFLIDQSDFSGKTRKWKFYIVGKKLSEDVQRKVSQLEKEGNEQFLYLKVDNFSIFALNWDDLFQTFKLKISFILSKLNIDREVLLRELKKENIKPESMPDYLVETITTKKPIDKSRKSIQEQVGATAQ